MSQLPSSHLEIHEHFLSGGFSVQRGSQNPFGKIPADQTIEETVNRDTKTPGGTKGFSLKSQSLSRYYMTAEYRSVALREMREMIHHPTPQFSHSDLHAPRIKKDHVDTKAVIDILEHEWTNPLSGEQSELVSISTGRLATTIIANDLKRAHDVGAEAYNNFKKNRLEADPPKQTFYDKIAKTETENILRFDQAETRDTIEWEGNNPTSRQTIVRTHDSCSSESRARSSGSTQTSSRGPIPWSLATPDGSLR